MGEHRTLNICDMVKMTFEQDLQREIDRKRNIQWKICKDWEVIYGKRDYCKLYNKDICPLRCNYAINKLREPLYVNGNIQGRR